MSSGSIRIIQLTEKSSVNTDDYMAVDSSANGTKKIKFTDLLDNNLSTQNKAADAQATGEAINDVNARVDNLIDCQNESVTNLWTGSLYTKNASVTLSDSISNYDFIDVYLSGYSMEYTRRPVSSTMNITMNCQNMIDTVSQAIHWYEVGITLSGTTATLTRTIACDWNDFSNVPVVAESVGEAMVITRIDGIKKAQTSNSEIADARVGADGVTYNSLGTAIRTQVSDLKSEIDVLESYNIKKSINLYDYDAEDIVLNTYIDTTTGEETAYNNWSSSPFIPVEPNTSYRFIYKYSIDGTWYAMTSQYSCEYDENKQRVGAIDTRQVFTTSPTAKYVRFSQNVINPTTDKWSNLMLVTSAVATSYLGSQMPYVPYYMKIVLDDIEHRVTTLERNETVNEERITRLEQSNSGDVVSDFGTAYLLRKNEIPSYYTEAPASPASFDDTEYLEGKISSVPSGKHFVILNDPHYPSNQKHSTALISYICNRINVEAVVMGGDILDRAETKYIGANELEEYKATMLSAVGDRYLPVLGNHDINTANTSGWTDEQLAEVMIPYNYVYSRMFAGINQNVVVDDASKVDELDISDAQKSEIHSYMKCHYYYDDLVNKTRYIMVVTGNTNSGIIKNVFGLTNSAELLLQYEWLYETLMTVPEGFDVVLTGHAMVTWGNTASPESDQVMTYCLKVCEMLSALKVKGSCTVTNDKTNSVLNAYYARGDHEYDFSEASNVGTILVLGADTHWDCQCVCYDNNGTYVSQTITNNTVFTSDAIIAIVTQTDAQGRSSYSGQPYANKPYPMTTGTVTEQCFDIVTIGDGVTFTRIGAGNDRHFNYN